MRIQATTEPTKPSSNERRCLGADFTRKLAFHSNAGFTQSLASLKTQSSDRESFSTGATYERNVMKKRLALFLCSVLVLPGPSTFADDTQTLPDPDGKPADMSRPVQVYILLGQSNMLGFGKIKPGKKGPGRITDACRERERTVSLPY